MTYNVFRLPLLQRLLVITCTAISASLLGPAWRAEAIDRHWVGYQFGPPGGFGVNPFQDASFFHSDNWFGYDVPASGDHAIFDAIFDPQGNGMPFDLYFGDYTVGTVPIYAPDPVFVAGGAASVSDVTVRNGAFTFHFTDQYGQPQGGLSATSSLHVSGDANDASLTLVGGQVSAPSAAMHGQGHEAKLVLKGAQLTIGGLVDVGVAGTRGELRIENNSLFQAGYTRVGENLGSTGLMTVTGSQAKAQVAGMQIGATGSGRVKVLNGATLESSQAIFIGNFGATSNGALEVDALSKVLVDGSLIIGDSGQGRASVSSGGTVFVNQAYIGLNSTANGELELDGVGAKFVANNEIVLGGAGSAGGVGKFTARNGGSLEVGSSLRSWNNANIDVRNGGAILLGASSSPSTGAITIGQGATFAGSATVWGDVNLVGGTVSPGASPGTIVVNGNLNLGNDGTLVLEIGGDMPGLYDQILVQENLHVGGNLIVRFLNNWAPTTGGSFPLIKTTSLSGSDFSSVRFEGIEPSLVPSNWLDGRFAISIVPEPTSFTLLVLSATLLLYVPRRFSS
jgi:T5SS/PEP-CTERM-associated repeat protein